MRLFRTLCATLGTLFIVSAPTVGTYAAAPLSVPSDLANSANGLTTLSAAAADASDSSPSLALLIALIVGIIAVVVTIVVLIYVKRSKRAHKSQDSVVLPAPTTPPVQVFTPEASASPAPASSDAPAQSPSADLTPRETGFVWQPQAGPVPTQQSAPQAPPQSAPKQAQKKRFGFGRRASASQGQPAQPAGAPDQSVTTLMSMFSDNPGLPAPQGQPHVAPQPGFAESGALGGAAATHAQADVPMQGDRTELLTTFGDEDSPADKTQILETFEDRGLPEDKTQLLETVEQGDLPGDKTEFLTMFPDEAVARPSAERGADASFPAVTDSWPQDGAVETPEAPAADAPEDPGMLTVKLPRFKPEAPQEAPPQTEATTTGAPQDPGMLTVKLPRFKPAQPEPVAEPVAEQVAEPVLAEPEQPEYVDVPTVKLLRFNPEQQTAPVTESASAPDAPEQPEYVDVPTIMLLRFNPEQASVAAPAAEPEPEPVATTEPEPEPVATTEPEPVAATEPEPEPELLPAPAPVPMPEHVAESDPVRDSAAVPSPVVIPAPEPVVMPEPEVSGAPAQASSEEDAGDAGLTTVQMPHADQMDSFDWDALAARQPEPHLQGGTPEHMATPEQMPAPGQGFTPAQQLPPPATSFPPAGQLPPPAENLPPVPLPAPPQDAPVQDAAPATPQIPPALEGQGGFQESWTSQFSWSEEVRQEPDARKKRKRWPWSRRRKQQDVEDIASTTPPQHEAGSSTNMPIIAVDAQDDDWQNWNSRN